MNLPSAAEPSQATLSISAVERDTGISKDTLRVWERRYGYPKPLRDSFGERAYSIEQVDKLRLLRRLLDQGHRPGRIINLGSEQLQKLAEQIAQTPVLISDKAGAQSVQSLFDLIRSHEINRLRRELSQLVSRLGVERFVNEIAAPLNQTVGEAWARGSLEIYEEHLYTESMQIVMRNAISRIPVSDQKPRVLLTTFPNEPHGLGLLMAEALMAIDGAHCLSLGCETPVGEIVRAVQSNPCEVIALSFSACLSANIVIDGINELRAGVPSSTEIWTGGYCPALIRKPPKGICVMSSLSEIGPALQKWREKTPVA